MAAQGATMDGVQVPLGIDNQTGIRGLPVGAM